MWHRANCLKIESSDGKIVALKLHSNDLTGILLNEMFELPYLQVFDLHDNVIEFLFIEISNT